MVSLSRRRQSLLRNYLFLLALALFVFSPLPISAVYTSVSAFAGNEPGTSGYSGDGGPAILAKFKNPKGIGFSQEGVVYIADSGNHVIRRVGLDGIVATVVGNGTAMFCGDGGPALNACLNDPNTVFVDPITGDMLISDRANQRIRKVFASNQTIVTVAGNGVMTFSGDRGPATDASLCNPREVCLDLDGNIIIADACNLKIRKVFKENGTITTIMSGDSTYYSNPQSVYLERDLGTFLVAHSGSQSVSRIFSNGTKGFIAGNTTSAAGCGADNKLATQTCSLNPRAAVKTPDGKIFIAEGGGYRISVIDPNTGLVTLFAGDGTTYSCPNQNMVPPTGNVPLKTACFLPYQLGLSPTGTIFIGDYYNHRILQIKPTDFQTTWQLSPKYWPQQTTTTKSPTPPLIHIEGSDKSISFSVEWN